MNEYEVELIHEPSGAHMSVVVLDYKEGDE